MGARPPALIAAALFMASLAVPATGVADHIGVEPSVSAEVTTLKPSSAKVRINVEILCSGASGPSSTSYGGSLDLVDLDTGEETYLGDVFGSSSQVIQSVERRDHDRHMQPRLRNAFCFVVAGDGAQHGSGMATVVGNIVVIPAKGAGDGGGGPGGGGGSGGSPDDPLAPGGCANEILGTPGADDIDATSAGDLVLALGGRDRVRGRGSHDCLVGGAGSDRLTGDEGHDRLTGGPGADLLDGGAGRNAYDAGPGRDRVKSRNGRAETVRCGPGEDHVHADRSDRLRDCERVSPASRAA